MNPFFNHLTAEHMQFAYLLYDNDTAHTADNSMDIVCELYEEKVIRKYSGLLHLPVLVTMPLFLRESEGEST
jgi:hypothetical protein